MPEQVHHTIVTSGHGPNLVLIHGLGGSHASWNEIEHQLKESFRIIRYDLRGHGKSHNPTGPWDLEDFLHDLQEVYRQADIQKAHVVGFSLGGLIAQKLAIEEPNKIDRLVILSAVAGRTEQEKLRVQERIKNLEAGDLETNKELALERWFSPEFRQSNPDKVKARLDALNQVDPTGYMNAYRVFGLGDLADDLARIIHKTLVMTGEHDPGSNIRMAELMHQSIPNSEMEILTGLRHSLLVEAPELVASKLKTFLD